jgi:uncharacterized MAPEG superfamily protein
MIEIIAGTALLYLVQLLLPMRLKTGSEQAKRAAKAVKNLGESLPVFFTLAVLSVVLGVDENTSIALYWLITRLLFLVIYITGIGRQERLQDGTNHEPQKIRSLIWAVSVLFLIQMTVNLI